MCVIYSETVSNCASKNEQHIKHWSTKWICCWLQKVLFLGILKTTQSKPDCLSAILLKTLLVDVPKTFKLQNQNWLDNEIIFQVFQSSFQDKIEERMKNIVLQNFSVPKTLEIITSWIRGEMTGNSTRTIFDMMSENTFIKGE